MKGTLISILVGALGGVLLTVGSNVHASRVAATAKHASSDSVASAPVPVAPEAVSDPAAPPSDQASPEQ